MKIKVLTALFTILSSYGFSQDITSSGLSIEYGPNLGTTHIGPNGAKYFYVHSTAIITNDSSVSIDLHLELAEEFAFPTYCNDDNYKVFLLPEEYTPDTATIYNNIVNGQHEFLDTPLENSRSLNKTLGPGEFCVVTIGVLTLNPTNCAAVPRAMFSHDNQGLYQFCDKNQNEAISSKSELQIGVKLEYYYKRKFIAPEDGCVVIPFGQISYPGN